VCRIAVSQWPVIELLHKMLPWNQEVAANELLVAKRPASSPTVQQKPRLFQSAVQDATHNAVQIGLKLTGLALRLAQIVVTDVRRSMAYVRRRAVAEEPSRASQLMREVQQQLTRKAHRENLQLQGKDAAFMQMLHSLDRCHMDLDSKWASVVEHTADKAEFSDKLASLYNLAKKSKGAVDTLLRPDASRQEINAFWKSEETKSLIAEEDALKQLVFAQMLQASS